MYVCPLSAYQRCDTDGFSAVARARQNKMYRKDWRAPCTDWVITYVAFCRSIPPLLLTFANTDFWRYIGRLHRALWCCGTITLTTLNPPLCFLRPCIRSEGLSAALTAGQRRRRKRSRKTRLGVPCRRRWLSFGTSTAWTGRSARTSAPPPSSSTTSSCPPTGKASYLR